MKSDPFNPKCCVLSRFIAVNHFSRLSKYGKIISPLLYGTSVYVGKCIFSIKDNLSIWAAFGAGLFFFGHVVCFMNKVGYKVKKPT